MDYNPSIRPKPPVRNHNDYHVNGGYNEYERHDVDEGSEELNHSHGDQEDEDDNDGDNVEEEDQQGHYRFSRAGVDAEESSRRNQKKRRLDMLVPTAPRSDVKFSEGFSKSADEWSDNRTFDLLEVWGERYLQLDRKSLRADDWVEVAEKVSEMSHTEISVIDCRNRFEKLKKKYKKEKAKMAETAVRGRRGGGWVFFENMNTLLSPNKQYNGLPCGIDSGEYVFMNPRVYLDQSNALNEMRDSPVESESDGDDSDEGKDNDGFRLLVDSVQTFGEIYEKIEGKKRQQMFEIEKMRMDFQRELELQKKQILERAHAEIARIRQKDDKDTDFVKNRSG